MEVENVLLAMERVRIRIGSVQEKECKLVVAVMDVVRVARAVDEVTPFDQYSFSADCVS